jgi:hypothetical protein
MLPLLPELADSNHPVACIHNVACDCSAEIPLEFSIFEDKDNPVQHNSGILFYLR